MAQPRTWLPRADEIAQCLRKMRSRDLDRAAIEELFQLQRRAALTLMEQVGVTAERGKPSTISRTSLLSWVERVAKEESWQLERRKDLAADLSQSQAEVLAVREALREAHRPTPKRFTIVRDVLGATCETLPSNIRLEPHRITIHLDRVDADVQACELFYMLAMVFANDPDGVCTRLVPTADAKHRAV